MTAHNLHKVNFSPTRGDNILDLVLCSGQLQASSESGDSLFASDHNSLRIEFCMPTNTKPSCVNRQIFNFHFHKADLNDLQKTIDCIPWCLLEATDDCDATASLFYNFVEAAVIDVVPTVRPRQPSPPWFDSKVRHALRAKEKAHPTPDHTELFKQVRSNFKRIVRAKYAKYLTFVKNPKRFWSFIKSRRNQHSLPSLIRNENSGLEAADSAAKASLLMDSFQSVYLPPSPELDATMPSLQSTKLDIMPALRITASDVFCKLTDIDPSKSSGADNLSGFVLKSCARVLCGPLAYLFKRASK